VTGAGITVGSASNVQNCSAFLNKGDGIRASNDCNIIANVCSTNGNGGDGAGVHVFFGNSRIEGNNVTNNDRGIEVGFAGNLIIKNSARVNGTGSAGNYVIAADNRYGPIIDDTAAGSIAASGKGPFTSTLTTTDPWANFSY
jgi:parallel beta-helix repeat protein